MPQPISIHLDDCRFRAVGCLDHAAPSGQTAQSVRRKAVRDIERNWMMGIAARAMKDIQSVHQFGQHMGTTSSGMQNFDGLTVGATENNPIERFDDLLASFSDPTESSRQHYHRSLVNLLERFLNHLKVDERCDLLRRFGAAMSQHAFNDIDLASLMKIVSSNEDVLLLFHTSGLSLSALKQIQPNQANNHRLVRLAQLSEICPLVSIEPLSSDLSSLFRNFLSDPLPYLINDHPIGRSSFSAFMDILCNEMMAWAILGIGDVVYETIVTNFPAFSESILREQTEHPDMDYDYRDLQKIIEISKKEHDPVKRIAAFIDHLENQTIYEGSQSGNHPMNLLSQCLQHTATFLNAHPDLIDSFLETVDLSSSPSNTPFRPDRHLNLISALSQSSSPLFTKLSESLLDPSFPLRSLLTTRSFTDPASSFIRMASTNSAFFRRLVERHTRHILDIAFSTVVSSVRVVSDSSSERHCLNFGRATLNFIVLLKAMAEVQMDLTQNSEKNSENFNSIPSSLLTLLVLSAASTHDELSNAAVSVFSNQFCLSTTHTKALLFATPTTFPVSDAFTFRPFQTSRESDHTRRGSLSICAEAGCRVLFLSRSDVQSTPDSLDFANKLGIPFAGCLVKALHSTTTLPHSFPFFSPELCRLSEQPSVWNESSSPSALTALTTLADIEITLTCRNYQWDPFLHRTCPETRDTNFVHLFPFLGPESQTQFLSSFNAFCRNMNTIDRSSLDRIVACLVEMATVNSYNTPIALLRELRKVAELPFYNTPTTSSFQDNFADVTPSERSIVEKLRTAEGEERWKLLTQLAVVSGDTPDIANELMKAENDEQALLILSVHKIQSIPRPNLHLDTTPDVLDTMIKFARHINNLPLVAATLIHIADAVDACPLPPLNRTLYHTEPKPELQELAINTLQAIAPHRREGVEEGCAVGEDEVTSQIVDSCLKVMQFLMNFKSFDPTPAIDSLISLAVTTDLSLLRSILVILEEIEERTRNTPTPFSISRATAPFRGIHESSVTQQPLPSIVSHILLSARLDSFQPLSQPNKRQSPFGFSPNTSQPVDSISLSRLIRELNENLFSDVTKDTAKTACLLLEERRASSSTILKSDDRFGVSLAQIEIQTTPQQLFIALHTILVSDDPSDISASTLLPIAPFLTRILSIVVPSSPDRVTIRPQQDEHSQLLDIFLSLVLSLINTGTPSTLSTPPLSSLLSVLSIALVRLDTIPSSLKHHSRFWDIFSLSENRSNPQLKLFLLALCSEGMEDRSDLSLDSFSMEVLNKWTGANAQRHVDRTIPAQNAWNTVPQPYPRYKPGPHNGVPPYQCPYYPGPYGPPPFQPGPFSVVPFNQNPFNFGPYGPPNPYGSMTFG
ncbi:hypothetical protein BLNAU_18850 [Blattamonas nauphoetae]|uniref:Uncharacterized protein n=1 Tax=Blattamonas nauphoetae TaxID=2049346 RepID=A0ABQ9X3U6_9EUKA|nr:hypothetical protein BLNAU_18850 [Blattamonas nauphoetae]